MSTLQLTVPTMACSVCADTITKAVQEIDAAATVQADPKTKLVNIDTAASNDTIKQAIVAAGYPVE